MTLFKCKMCGGTLEINNETVATCEYCGTQQTLPKLADDRRANLYDRANHFRRNNEFDKAMGIYENILNEDNTDAEAYWSLVLCRYGIEYVEDPSSHKRMPTVNRAQFTSIFDDDNYKSALQYADGYQRSIYEAEAKAINEIQKGILAISQKEEPFDVFICYKETDSNGRRTPDSVLANDLYHQLTQEGFKVFFARITLEDKLGVAYEPYIFAALNSAKVMVALGTKPEYFNAVWVKNEWSRYLALIKNGAKKILIPAYKDMDPYDLPEEFSHLQAQDMGKLGFMQDLIRGIKKIAQTDAPKATVIKETAVAGSSNNTAPLLERVFMFLEDGDWDSANEYCEKVLDIDPKNAQAYLGKLMAELHVKKQENLQDQAAPFDGNNHYQKAIRFADDSLRTTLTGYIEFINNRNEHDRLEGIYNKATSQKRAAKTEEEFRAAATTYGTIATYRDADALKQECLDLAENARKDAIYDKAKSLFSRRSVTDIEQAIKQFKTIPGWKDADEKVIECQQKIELIKREDEEKRIQDEKKKKIRTKKMIIESSIGAAIVAVLIVLFTVIIPAINYNKADALMEEGKYDEAIEAFEELAGYKDSETKIEECEEAILGKKYNEAVALMDAGKYSEALSAFEAINGYKDSLSKINDCKYINAIALMEEGKYDEAILAFKALTGYKDSETKIEQCEEAILDKKYNEAVALMDAGKYDESISAFEKISGYKDSQKLAVRLAFNGTWEWINPGLINPWDSFVIDTETQSLTYIFDSTPSGNEFARKATYSYTYEVSDTRTIVASGLRGEGTVTLRYLGEGKIQLIYPAGVNKPSSDDDDLYLVRAD